MKIEEAVAIVRDGVAEPMKKVGFDLPALQEICRRHSEAMEVLAKEYVAQHREDDGEALTESWFEEEYGAVDLMLGSTKRIAVSVSDGLGMIAVVEIDQDCRDGQWHWEVCSHITTRRQLRALVASLGGEA